MWRKILLEVICFLYILLFLYAALAKVVDYPKFRIQIGQSPLLTGLGETIPWMVIAVEILIAVLLMVPRTRLAGLYGAFSLMTMFTAYIIAILQFSSYIPCSCGGILEKLGWTEHLIFNIGFMTLAVLGVVVHAPVISGDIDCASEQ